MLTLTATDLPRFMVCNGSITMPTHKPFNVDDTMRDEGNAAHWLIEQVHKKIHGTDELVDRKAFNGVFITEEMVEHVTPFLNDIRGKGVVECDTSYGGQRYQINGRADHIYYDPQQKLLEVSDFKYGWSIVEPKNNWTLISHAIGWLHANPNIPPSTIVFKIYQPRPHHPLGKVRQYSITWQEFVTLMNHLQTVLSVPNDQLNTSAECRNCPARVTCPAAQKAEMNSIDVSEVAFVSEVDNSNLGYVLDQIDRAIKMLEQGKKAYSELALHRLKKGDIIPGYGVEKELTNKQWKTGITPESLKLMTGKDLSKASLITPAQAVKKGMSEAVVDALCERREKGVKLARMDVSTAAKKMFGDIK